jgi:hypothetical protein
MASIKELRAKLRINKSQLEDACLEQVSAFADVCEELAYRVSDRDLAKEALATLEARADRRIRAQSEGRPREADVEAQKQLDRELTEARRKFLELNESVLLTEALKQSFQMRGYVLKDLVQLWVHNYYGQLAEQAPERMRDADANYLRGEIARMNREGRHGKRQ